MMCQQRDEGDAACLKEKCRGLQIDALCVPSHIVFWVSHAGALKMVFLGSAVAGSAAAAGTFEAVQP